MTAALVRQTPVTNDARDYQFIAGRFNTQS